MNAMIVNPKESNSGLERYNTAKITQKTTTAKRGKQPVSKIQHSVPP
jgi:hypothetical protein